MERPVHGSRNRRHGGALERGPSLVAEVRAALSDELAYTTVLTVLRTLEGKGYVSARRRPWPSIFRRRKAKGRAKKCPAAPDTQALQGIGRIALRASGSDQRLSEKQIRNMRKLTTMEKASRTTFRFPPCPTFFPGSFGMVRICFSLSL